MSAKGLHKLAKSIQQRKLYIGSQNNKRPAHESCFPKYSPGWNIYRRKCDMNADETNEVNIQ